MIDLRCGRIFIILGLLFAMMKSPPVHAWGIDGHRIVAGIAKAGLTSTARNGLDRLLALEPGATLESISTWADERRSPATASWHYVNFPRTNCTFSPERDCPDGRCVVAAIEKQLEILKHDVSDEKRLRALKYLVHFVGDVHQPLHAGYSDDKGGNTYQLQAFMQGTNLHALWDKGMISHLDEEPETTIKRLSTKTLPKKQGDISMVQAAEESCQILRMPGFYPGRKVGEDYVERFTPVLERRLLLAGQRLAGLLNIALSRQE